MIIAHIYIISRLCIVYRVLLSVFWPHGQGDTPMSNTYLPFVSGFITPFVMYNVLGSQGGYLLVTMLTMALMSTGSGEVMAVASIVVYDIYKIYINPFR